MSEWIDVTLERPPHTKMVMCSGCNLVMLSPVAHTCISIQTFSAGILLLDGLRLIAAERSRQVWNEKWTPEHDDTHADGELAKAAVCYVLPENWRQMPLTSRKPKTIIEYFLEPLYTRGWGNWFKPSPDNRIRELVKAGALIAAEIDRLQRLETQGNHCV